MSDLTPTSASLSVFAPASPADNKPVNLSPDKMAAFFPDADKTDSKPQKKSTKASVDFSNADFDSFFSSVDVKKDSEQKQPTQQADIGLDDKEMNFFTTESVQHGARPPSPTAINKAKDEENLSRSRSGSITEEDQQSVAALKDTFKGVETATANAEKTEEVSLI